MYKHIVQTEEWAELKDAYGTPVVKAGEIFYTKHKIPKSNYFMAYCPRVNPELIDFEKLRNSLRENNCVGLTFDVPNVLKNSPDGKKAKEMFEKHCINAARSEFATANFLMDISKPEKELFENMHKKHRYNARYAARKGVTIKLAETEADFEEFFQMFKETSLRQKYFIRPKRYYRLIWEKLHTKDMCHILTAMYEGKPLASWMVFLYENVIYYPYGGSSEEHRNLYASNALGWEAIRFGKEKGCEIFDMWGAAEDPEDKSDGFYGFTRFKEKFGAEHVRYLDSYDMVINKLPYFVFRHANNLRWKLLDLGLIK
jgi:lipid II:glycine glycyltransferase (peptidoglycan interpeptide bridge formation enzyme)